MIQNVPEQGGGQNRGGQLTCALSINSITSMDWHDSTCRRLDKTRVGSLVTCLSCGSSTTQFEYPPIKQRKELRLLRIEPGEFDEPIRCEIFTDYLFYKYIDFPEFEAISYTWADESGDSSECCSIFLNAVPFPVTRNCERALKRARERPSRAFVWIDAICIDQSNDAERGQQVRLMPDIYSRAKTVLVYIGEEDNNSSWLLNTIAKSTSADWKNLATAAIGQALADLWRRRFFSRVWVLQEVTLARKADLICGNTTIPWRYLQPPHLTSLGLLGWTSSPDLRPPAAIYFDHKAFTHPNQLLNLLDFASICKAQDPRDKVYSLLGLLPGGTPQGLDVDYTLSVDRVYMNTAHFLAQRFGWYRVLYHARVREPRVPDLPSWAPDWSVPRSQFKQLVFEHDHNYPESFTLRALRAESTALFFEALEFVLLGDLPAWEETPLPDGGGMRRVIRLLATWEDAAPWQKPQQPSICFPNHTRLLDLLRNEFSIDGWASLYEYTTWGRLIESDDSEGCSVTGDRESPGRYRTYKLIRDQMNEPERWDYVTADHITASLTVSPAGLIRLLRVAFEMRGLALNIPLDSAAWRLVRINQLDDPSPEVFSVPSARQRLFDRAVACIEILSEKGEFGQGDVVSEMAVELLKANFMMGVREICIV